MTSKPVHCGIFGGTFDPIHVGHTRAVRQVIESVSLDQVRVIPVSKPPHRRGTDADASHRLEMVRIALADESDMVADPREVEREGKSFTIDTVKALQAEMPDTHFSLILGMDAALGLAQWHRWEKLLSLVSVVVMARPGWTLPDPPPHWWQVGEGVPGRDSAGKIYTMEISPQDMSASLVRRYLHRGQDASSYLHPGVYDYIRKHNLYRNLYNAIA